VVIPKTNFVDLHKNEEKRSSNIKFRFNIPAGIEIKKTVS
jgi:hypothetical protein